MSKSTDVRPLAAELYFLPVVLRVPLKFGTEVTTSITCARVRLTVADRSGRRAYGWGETPLAVQWAWPSELSYVTRHERMKALCVKLSQAWSEFNIYGHPLEVGHDFQSQRLASMVSTETTSAAEPMPYLAALICTSLFDLALHDAFGKLHGIDTYRSYSGEYMNRDLRDFLVRSDRNINFEGTYPSDFLIAQPRRQLQAWHLVGGLDALDSTELTGNEPSDCYPVTLIDWIRRDGLNCLKIKLRGNDVGWDYARILRVGQIGSQNGVEWFTADFNCTVTDPDYVNDVLDRLRREHPTIFERLLYVEQPFPYDLDAHPIDVHSVSRRKPLFLDESAHDWRYVAIGRELGWTGVALKTCKTQTGAILSLCWAKGHDMPLMVQDLTNPMLAQIPHVRLASHAGTIMGVESNGMQFYPHASLPEAAVHPGLYRRRTGMVDLDSIGDTGFGYRVDEIARPLPPAAAICGDPA